MDDDTSLWAELKKAAKLTYLRYKAAYHFGRYEAAYKATFRHTNMLRAIKREAYRTFDE
jgi:hypothetical protein